MLTGTSFAHGHSGTEMTLVGALTPERAARAMLFSYHTTFPQSLLKLLESAAPVVRVLSNNPIMAEIGGS
jgi:hypothetical protein